MNQAALTRQKNNTRFADLYNQLNAEQRQAVDAIEGVVMVLAGPGTGKTQLLAMRIATILQRTQMDPWNILCLTFTESGVVAMRERLLSIMGEAAYYVRIHTFHSFCNEIIQEHPELFARKQEWQPLSEVERIELLESLLDSLPGTSPLRVFGQPYFYIRDISRHIQSLKQEHIAPDDLRRVCDSIALFVREAESVVSAFFSLTPKQRTDEACETIFMEIVAYAQKVHLPDSVQKVVERVELDRQRHVLEADGLREASKARTLYKNTIKRWFVSLARDVQAQQVLADLYKDYQNALVERGRYDYEDMITQVIETWTSNANLLADYQEQFQYILVDEYQDTNGAQNEIVRLLGSFDDRPNICVVGDDKQSIYRFQGASLANMLHFFERYQDHVVVVTLRDNYRSQATVLAAADGVIRHNEESLTRYIPGTTTTLTPWASWPAAPLVVWEAPTCEVEDFQIGQRISELVQSGVAPQEIAVIARYHRDVVGIFNRLRQLGVPVRLEAGEDALQEVVVRQFLQLLEFINDVRRDPVLAQVLHFSWLKLAPLDILKVIRFAGLNHTSVWSVIAEAGQLHEAGVTNPEPWQHVVKLIAQWRVLHHNTSLQNFLQVVLQESGLLAFMLLPETAPGVLQAMRRFLDEVKTMNAGRHAATLVDLLGAVSRLSQHGLSLMTSPWQVSGEAVRVLTAHKAKGLEFEHVFLVRMLDTHWGNNRSSKRLPLPAGLIAHDLIVGTHNNEDERRLFFVALTRAKASLTLSYARVNETGRPAGPSLFLSELPDETYVRAFMTEEFAAGQERIAASLVPAKNSVRNELSLWVAAQLEHYVMSVTHLNNYLTCPHMFYVRNVLRVPSVRTVHQALGTATHEALNGWLGEYQQTGYCPSRDWFLAVFVRHVQREVLSAAEERDVIDVGTKILMAYYDQYASSFNARAVGEFDFSSHGVRVGDAAITGKIDKIEWLDEARTRANVVDYKTGQPDGKAAALRPGGDYYRQLVFYQLLCDVSPRFSGTMVSGEIDFVQANKKGQFVKKRIQVSAEDREELQQTISRVWHEIHDLRFLDPATWCGTCEYCQKP